MEALSTAYKPLPFKTAEEVVAAFDAGAKFEVVGNAICCPVPSDTGTVTKLDGDDATVAVLLRKYGVELH